MIEIVKGNKSERKTNKQERQSVTDYSLYLGSNISAFYKVMVGVVELKRA
jgi:hypothetical protein